MAKVKAWTQFPMEECLFAFAIILSFLPPSLEVTLRAYYSPLEYFEVLAPFHVYLNVLICLKVANQNGGRIIRPARPAFAGSIFN